MKTRTRCGASEGPLIDLILCASGAPCLVYESFSLDSDPAASAWGRGYLSGMRKCAAFCLAVLVVRRKWLEDSGSIIRIQKRGSFLLNIGA